MSPVCDDCYQPGPSAAEVTALLAEVDAFSTARSTWQAAGGAIPSLGGVKYGGASPGTSSAGPSLGTSPNILSSFKRIGSECFATMRIHSGASPTDGIDWTTIQGLPVAPKYQGSGAEGGQPIGHGFIFDLGNGGRFYPATVVIDPAFSWTEPLIFVGLNPVSATDPAGLASAAVTGAVTTTTPAVVPTKTAWGPMSFTPTAIMFQHGAVAAGSSPLGSTSAAGPVALSGGFIMNFTFQYEGVAS